MLTTSNLTSKQTSTPLHHTPEAPLSLAMVANEKTEKAGKKILIESIPPEQITHQWAIKYLKGTGVTKNVAMAKKILKLCAEKGCGASHYSLASLYNSTAGGHFNLKKSLNHLDSSATLNHPDAHLTLARKYVNGVMVQTSIALALRHYGKALELGSHGAQKEVETFVSEGKFLFYKWPESVLTYCQTVADQGNLDLQYALGCKFYSKKSSIHDKTTAEKYFTLSANQGHVAANYTYGCILLREAQNANLKHAAPYNAKALEGIERLKFAAKCGNPIAPYELGKVYYYGNFVEQNFSEAARYYHQSAELGYGEAMHAIALLYFTGLGVKQNMEAAFSWWVDALELSPDNAIVIFRLGLCYLRGYGVAVDEAHGIKLIERSAELNYSQAISFLKLLRPVAIPPT